MKKYFLRLLGLSAGIVLFFLRAFLRTLTVPLSVPAPFPDVQWETTPATSFTGALRVDKIPSAPAGPQAISMPGTTLRVTLPMDTATHDKLLQYYVRELTSRGYMQRGWLIASEHVGLSGAASMDPQNLMYGYVKYHEGQVRVVIFSEASGLSMFTSDILPLHRLLSQRPPKE